MHKDQPITLIDMNERKSLNDRLLCQICMCETQEQITVQPLRIIQEKIKNRISNFNITLDCFDQKLKNKIFGIIKTVDKAKSDFLQSIDIILSILTNYIDNIDTEMNSINNITLEQGLQIIKNDSEKLDRIQQEQLSNLKKSIQNINEKLQVQLKKFTNANKNLQNAFPIVMNQEIQQNAICKAIAFNKNGTIMASAAENDIKIWKFEVGLLTLIKTLSPYQSDIEALLFSQKSDTLYVGYYDGKIISFDYDKEDTQTKNKNKNHNLNERIFCMKLKKKEDQLITCGQDKYIYIWDVDPQTKNVELSYQLEGHKGSIFSISLNEPETFLVSSGYENEIIIWYEKEHWQQKQKIIMQNDYGFRICFINTSTFIWLQEKQGYVHIFKLNHQTSKFQEQEDEIIELESKNNSDDFGQFPPKFLVNNQVLMIKHSKYVYLIDFKKQNNRIKYFDCLSSQNYGDITPDGKYLVVWNKQNNQYQVFGIEQ